MKKLIKLEQPGCSPCFAVGKYLDNELEVGYTAVDVTEFPEVASHYEIASVPTVILIDVDVEDELIGKELARSIKFNPEELDVLAENLEG